MAGVPYSITIKKRKCVQVSSYIQAKSPSQTHTKGTCRCIKHMAGIHVPHLASTGQTATGIITTSRERQWGTLSKSSAGADCGFLSRWSIDLGVVALQKRTTPEKTAISHILVNQSHISTLAPHHCSLAMAMSCPPWPAGNGNGSSRARISGWPSTLANVTCCHSDFAQRVRGRDGLFF